MPRKESREDSLQPRTMQRKRLNEQRETERKSLVKMKWQAIKQERRVAVIEKPKKISRKQGTLGCISPATEAKGAGFCCMHY